MLIFLPRRTHIGTCLLSLAVFAASFQNAFCFSMSSESTGMNVAVPPKDMRFGKFLIKSSSIFYRSEKSAAFVNLRPIVPGHVLVMPERIVPKMEDLAEDEYVDLWLSARKVQSALKKHYGASAFNVAVQDGEAAGQSVPHVHIHILPRHAADFERNDDVYDELEAWAPRDGMKKESKLSVPEDDDRKDRTEDQMSEEAETYRKLFQQ